MVRNVLFLMMRWKQRWCPWMLASTLAVVDVIFYVFGRYAMDLTKKVVGAQYGAGFNRPSEAFAYANAVVERNLAAALRSDFEMKQTPKTAPKRQRKSSEK